MGTGDAVTPTKPMKTLSAQEQLPSPASYVEWVAAVQAYYHGATPPPGYFPPGVASGQPHPYMWAGQPVIPPPYGPAPPFAAMYPAGPHGHPSMPHGLHPYPFGMTSPGGAADATLATATVDQGESKSSDGKDGLPIKSPKQIVVSPRGRGSKAQDGDKSTLTSTNGALSQSAESGSDGSSDGSEEDNRQDSHENRSYEQSGGSIGNTAIQAASAITALSNVPSSAMSGRPAGLVPTTNLNVGLEYWNAAPSATATAAVITGKGKRNPVATQSLVSNFQPTPPMAVSGREAATSDLWLQQDERELKRQRRKQSNRESARRSRLRKQAECEELATRVDTLTVENLALRSEINRLVEERNTLSAENASLLEKLRKDREKVPSGGRMSDVKSPESMQNNVKTFDMEPLLTQGVRQSREESGKPVENVATGLEMGSHPAAVTAS